MKQGLAYITAFGVGALFAMPAAGAIVYNNLTPNNQIAIATRPSSAGGFEIEAADDFLLGSHSLITSASFVGLVVPGAVGAFSPSDVVVEMYRVFPADSDTVRVQHVPTRLNSPSDEALASKDSGAGELTFNTSVLSTSFSTLNSIQPGGIHPSPGQNTLGNGPLTGTEIQFNVTFSTPFDLPADHYFFVPQVTLTNGAQFYWLSASRPIAGAGTTPFLGDLQAWTRDANLDPDWLRVGTDIVGGATPPTFNTAFSLDGTAVPEPGAIFLTLGGMLVVGMNRYARRR